MGIEGEAVDGKTGQSDCVADKPYRDKKQPWDKEEPTRAEQQKESKRSPPIAEGLQMRTMRDPAIRMQSDGNFAHLCLVKARFNNHFGREFHPGAALIELFVERFTESAQTAVNVVNRRRKPPPRQNAKHGIAPPAMQKRHRPGKGPSATLRYTAPLHQVISLSQF